MKKKIFMITLMLAACVVMVGCGKENNDNKGKTDTKSVGGWKTVITDKQVGLSEDELKYFNDAKDNYDGLDLKPVALLATQVVAGTNYMYLATGTPVVPNSKTSYKIVIVYRDLEGNTSISKVSDFEVSKYTNKDVDLNTDKLVGGWTVKAPEKTNILDDEKVAEAWKKANETLTGMTYNPIAIVGKQVVSGTNYAILCYAKGSYQDATESIYLVTLYVDLEGKQSITHTSYIDLAEFNN